VFKKGKSKIYMKDSCITFGIIIGTRGIFNPQLAHSDRKILLKTLDSLGYNSIILPEGETPSGNIETYQDAKKCASLFKKNQDKIDGILVILPNFGDELGIVNSIVLSGLNVPILVQASRDEIDKVSISERRDSFCGKISVCNNFFQYGIPFTDTIYHTENVDSLEFKTDLDRFARVCKIVSGLKNARLGAIGTRPAAFQTVRFSEKILQDFGITVIPIDLSEILAVAGKIDAVKTASKVNEIKNYGQIPSRILSDSILKQARFSLAVEEFIKKNELIAGAIQCWDSLEYNYGCAACLTMSMLNERGIPFACEMDIPGALSMLCLQLASGNAPALLDWNNNYGSNLNKCVCTHCSNFPRSFVANEVEISELDILGATIGQDKCFGAIKGHVASGDFTFFRVSTDDREGSIKSYVGEGKFTDDPFPMDGGIAVTEVKNLQKTMKYICSEGFEHHVAMVRGNVADVLEEAAKYLQWKIKNFKK
jgi:L-fucose isomerase-like protein